MEDVTFEVCKAFACKHAYAEAGLRHQRSARRCADLRSAITHLESAGANVAVIDAVREDLTDERAVCERLERALDLARAEFLTMRNTFATSMSAVFCAFNLLSDASSTQKDVELGIPPSS